LRTGHCGLRGHLHRIGVADTSSCSCGQDDQTPYHVVTVGCAATYTESGSPTHPHAPVARTIRLLTMSSRTALHVGKRGTKCGQREWTTETVGNGRRNKNHCPVHHIHQSKNLDARRAQKKKEKCNNENGNRRNGHGSNGSFVWVNGLNGVNGPCTVDFMNVSNC
jgi:hypothetical protein